MVLFIASTKLTIKNYVRFWCALCCMPFIPALKNFQVLW